MNLNEGLTKIIKEYPDIRDYCNERNKEERNLINDEMEEKKDEYTEFLTEFKQYINDILPGKTGISYDIKSSTFAQSADVVPYISMTNPNTDENYNLAYLFKPDKSGVYISLGLEVNRFKNDKNRLSKDVREKMKNLVNHFREHVKNDISRNNENNIELNKFSENCSFDVDKTLAKAYESGNIYCKFYPFNEEENTLLPSENELEEDLVEFLELYQHFRNYNDYFNEIKGNYFDNSESSNQEEDNNNDKEYDSFYEFLNDKKYHFDKETIENYLLSLKVKPFVILTGNSGTGKTKLSQLFAQYLNHEKNYKIIPVGANWTENRHILGYYNILKGDSQLTPAYYLIEHAQSKDYPHFLILDEMNLSHVERYFADFLSAIESGEPIPIHDENELEIPENLFIIGTVNVDETTYMFSPKVLDRANTIEFETYSAKDYMNSAFNENKPKGNISYLENLLEDKEIKDMNIQELKDFINNDEFWEELSDEIFKFQDILKKSGFDFGFRVINEITRFMAVAYKYEPENWESNWKRYFDAQIKQKMLPKLHGSQKVIGETLEKLLEECEEYPNSKKKLKEMIDVLEKQRYVSFIN